MVGVFSTAKPTEMILALLASHVVATFAFLYWGFTFRTLLDLESLDIKMRIYFSIALV
jgi:hypothetical protein